MGGIALKRRHAAHLRIAGMGSAMLSAVIFGANPMIAKAAYMGGSNDIALVFSSTLSALPILTAFMLLFKIPFALSKHQIRHILLTGFLGGVTTMLLFSAYNFVATGIATTLHFTYPAFVGLGSVILLGRKMNRMKVGALVMSLAGISLAAGSGSMGDMRGIVLALASGITYAAYILYLDKSGLKQMNFIKLCLYLSIVKTVIAGVYGLMAGRLTVRLSPYGFWMTILMGILAVILAVILFQIGVCYTGAANAAVYSLLEPVTSLLLGFLFMNEQITMAKGIGCLFILSGIFLTIKGDKISDLGGIHYENRL